jgi:hypothetical protein
MNKRNLQFLPRAKIDYSIRAGELIASADLKRIGEGQLVATWFVTGLTRSGELACLFTARIGLSASDEVGALGECERIAPQILQIAKQSIGLEGAPSAAYTSEVLHTVLQFHLREQFSLFDGTQGRYSLATRVVRAYQLCKSFGYAKTTEAIAEFESVPVSTIKRRLDSARDAGLIPKQRGKNAEKD